MANPAVGTEDNGYRFVGGDPASPSSWEPLGLKIGTVDSGYRFKGGDPAQEANWEPATGRRDSVSRMLREQPKVKPEGTWDDPKEGSWDGPKEDDWPAPSKRAKPGANKPPQPYTSRVQALDDAVNLVEEGQPLKDVIEGFAGIGLREADIVAHGVARKSSMFVAPEMGRRQVDAYQKPEMPAEPGRSSGRASNLRQDAYAMDAAQASGVDPLAAFKANPVGLLAEGLRTQAGWGDVAVAGAEGVVSGVRMIANSGGAGGNRSLADQGLDVAKQYLDSLKSVAAKKDEARVGQIMAEAQDSGVGDQIAAAAKAAMVAPASLIAQGLGTTVPVIVASLLPGVRESTLATLSTQLTIGTAMGAGAVKEAIFDRVRQEMIDQGMLPVEAEERARAAQMLTGENGGQIMAGAALAALASATGVEAALAPAMAARAVIPRSAVGKVLEAAERNVAGRMAIGGLREAVPEFGQGFQEQVAGNVAVDRQGIPTNPMRGAVGAGTLEAAAGFGAGGLIGAVTPAPPQAPTPTPSAEDMVRERFGPRSGGSAAPRTDTEVAAAVVSAPTVDDAIRTAETVVSAPAAPRLEAAAAVDNIGRILQGAGVLGQSPNSQESPDVSPSAGIPPVDPGADGTGLADTGIGLDAGAGTDGAGAPAVVAGDVGGVPAGAAVPPAAGQPAQADPAVRLWTGRRGDGYQSQADAQNALATRQKAEPDRNWKIEPRGERFVLAGYARSAPITTNQGWTVSRNDSGTLSIKGDPQAIRSTLFAAGVDKLAMSPTGVMVGVSQAESALAALQQPAQNAGDEDATPTPAATQATAALAAPAAGGDGASGALRARPAPETAATPAAPLPGIHRADGGVPARLEIAVPADPPPGGRSAAELTKAGEPPHMARYRAEAQEITASLPPVPEGHVRLWRGNRAGEVGKNPSFTNSLEGIAMPFRDAYGGRLSWVDVPAADLPNYEQRGAVAAGAEFMLPSEVAARAKSVGEDLPAAAPPPPPTPGAPRGWGSTDIETSETPAPAGVSASAQAETASWVLREKATGAVIMETTDRKKVEALNTAKYEAVPIQEHLGSLNRRPTGSALDRWNELSAQYRAGDEATQARLRPEMERLNAQLNPPAAEPMVSLGPTVKPAPAERYGVDNIALSEGGKPFKTERAVIKARKLQPQMRMVRVEGGYALVEKSEKLLAAQAKSAKRLAAGPTEKAGQPIAAHAFLAGRGGLSKKARSDLGIEGNVQVGSRWLFAKDGGLTLEQATELLHQHGYIQQEDQLVALAVISRSANGQPQYTPEGIERLAEMEREADAAAVAAPQGLEDNEPQALDDPDADIPWDAIAQPSTLADGLRALGATDEEIADAQIQAARGPEGARAADQGHIGAVQGVAGTPQGDPGGRNSQALAGAERDAGAAQGLNDEQRRLQDALPRGGAGRAGQGDRVPGLDQPAAAVAGKGQPERGLDEGDGDGALTAPTPEEVVAQQRRREEGERTERTRRASEEARARAEREQREIQARQDASAENFELGQSAEDALSGQRGVIDQPEAPQTDDRDSGVRDRIREYWRNTAAPSLRAYFGAFNDFTAERLERHHIKPKGMSAVDWLRKFEQQQSTWDRGRKTGQTGIQALSEKNLWPTEDGKGERLRKAMLEAVKALKAAPGIKGGWIDGIAAGHHDGIDIPAAKEAAVAAAPPPAPDPQRQLIELRKRKSVLESLLKCLE